MNNATKIAKCNDCLSAQAKRSIADFFGRGEVNARACSFPSALLFALLAFVPVFLASPSARASNDSWVNQNGGDWNTDANWSSGVPTATGTAYFNSAPAAPVTNATAVSVGNIAFDTAAGSLVIGATAGPAFTLTNSSGSIALQSTLVGTNVSETINAPLVLGSGAGKFACTFANNNTNATDTLVFNGAISGGASGTTTTLTLAGGSLGNNTLGGIISNGNSSALSLTATSGNWTLSGANTYTGNTYVDSGASLTLNFAAPGAPQNNILSSSGLFTAGIANVYGGTETLNLVGAANRANSQSFLQTGNLAINGALHINLTAGAGTGSITLNLGGITARGYGQALEINMGPSTTLGTNAFVTTTTGTTLAGSLINNPVLILGGTTFGASSSVSSPYAIMPCSYAASAPTVTAATNNGKFLDVTQAMSLASGAPLPLGTRFNGTGTGPGAETLTIGNGAILNSYDFPAGYGAILVTPNVGANLSRIAGAQGMVEGPNGRDLVIVQNNPFGDFELDAVATPQNGSGYVTVEGTGGSATNGRVILNGGVSLGGGILNEGTVVVGLSSISGIVESGSIGVGATTGTVGSTAGLLVGEEIQGPNVKGGPFITAITSGSTFTINGSTPAGYPSAGLMYFGGISGFGGMSIPGTMPTAWVAPGSILQIGNLANSGPFVTGGTSGSLASNQTVTLSGTLAFYRNDNGNLATNGTGLNFTNPISGPGTVVNNGSGLVVMSGNNTYTGGTVLNSGTLSVAADTGTSARVCTALSLEPATAQITPFAAGTTTIYVVNAQANGIVPGMMVTGSGLAFETVVTAVSGSQVTLNLSSTNANAGTALTFETQNALQNQVSVASAAGLTVGQSVSGLSGYANGDLIAGIFNTGTSYILTLMSSGSGNVNNTGTTTAVGTGTFAAYESLPSTGLVSFNGGTLQYGPGNANDYSARFSPAANQQYRINTNGNNVIFGTALTSNGGSFAKSGAGTLTLIGNNTYSGLTTISGGQLNINGLLAGPVIVQAGTVLGGTGQISGSVTFNGGTLQTTNSLNFNSLNINSGDTIISGTINVGSGGFMLTSGEFDVNGQLTSTSGVFIGGGASQAILGGTGTVTTGTFPVALNGNGTLQSTGILNLSNGIAVNGTANTIGLGAISAANTTLNSNAALVLSGSLTGNVIVSAPGAVLIGNGGVGGNLTVGNGGTAAPGTDASSGTLSVGGNVTLLDSGTLVLQVGMTANGSSRLAIAGKLDSSSLLGPTFTLKLAALPVDATEWNDASQTWSSVIATNGNFTSLKLSNIVIDASGWLPAGTYNPNGFSLVRDGNNLDLIYVGLSAITGSASGITYSSGTLNGTVHPNGLATTGYFQYGLTPSYGVTTAPQAMGSGTTAILSTAVTGLTAATTYHYQIVAVNNGGTVYGSDQTFTTSALPPTLPAVTTSPATGIACSTATLNGTINPSGSATTYWFQYGLTAAYGNATLSQPAGNGTTAITETAAIAGLTAVTTYHYHLVAVNSSGTNYGADQTFTTANPPPTVVTGTVAGTVYNATTLTGTVNASGLTTTYCFQYGVTAAYGNTTAVQPAGSSTTASLVNAPISELNPETTYHYQLVAANSKGTSYGADQTFTTANPPPTVTTGSATAAVYNGATLNGTVNPNGLVTTCYFQYGLTGAYGSVTTTQPAGSGTSTTPQSADIAGLTALTTYHCQLVAVNSSGTNYGADQTFATTNPPPTVTTGSATGVAYNAATLNGTINPNGLATAYYFRYGLTGTYGSITTTQSAGSAATATPENAAIAGLIALTTYHCQLVAVNSSGTSYGADRTFTTGNPPPPTVTTGSATGMAYDAATLNGTVNPNGLTTTWYFQYGLTGTYGSVTTAQSAGSGTSATPESSTISGLNVATLYHYRLVAANSSGTTYGSDQTVTTSPYNVLANPNNIAATSETKPPTTSPTVYLSPTNVTGHPCTLWDQQDINNYLAALPANPVLKSAYNGLVSELNKRMSLISSTCTYSIYAQALSLPGVSFTPQGVPIPQIASGTAVYLGNCTDVSAYNGGVITEMGIMYALTGSQQYGEYARQMLVSYANYYSQYGHPPGWTHNSYRSALDGRLSYQFLNDNFFLCNIAFGYDLIRNLPTLTGSDQDNIRVNLLEAIAAEYTDPILGTPDYLSGANNRCALSAAATLMAGYAADDSMLITEALYGTGGTAIAPKGGITQVHMGSSILLDGLWVESSIGYQTSIAACGVFDAAIMMEHHGIDAFGQYPLKRLLDSAIDIAYPNGNLLVPNLGNTGPLALVSNLNYSSTETGFPYWYGYLYYQDPRYLSIIRNQQQQLMMTAHNGAPSLYLTAPPSPWTITQSSMSSAMTSGSSIFTWLMSNGYFNESFGTEGDPVSLSGSMNTALKNKYPTQSGTIINILQTALSKEIPTPLSNANFFTNGYGVLRLSTSTGPDQLLVEYGDNNKSHGQPAALSLDFYAFGGTLMTLPGDIFPYNDPMDPAWYWTTLANNTVTVDGTSQIFGGNSYTFPKANQKPYTSQIVFGPALTMGIQKVSTSGTNSVYAQFGVTQDRAVFMLPNYTADLFGNFSGTTHTYDLAWHPVGAMTTSLSLSPRSSADFTNPGYSAMTNLQNAFPPGSWTAQITTPNGNVATLYAAANPTTEVIMGNGHLLTSTSGTKDILPPVILERNRNVANTIYGNVIDVTGSSSGYVTGVTQEGDLNSGYALLKVQTVTGGTDLCYTSYTPGTFTTRQNDLTTDAQQAFVVMNGTNVQGLYLGGGTTLTADAGSIQRVDLVTPGGPGLAYVEPAPAGYVIGNMSPTDATVTVSLPGVGSGTASIKAGSTIPSLSVGNASVLNVTSGTPGCVFAVILSETCSQTVTVNYATADGSAVSASNYIAQSGVLTFAPGVTVQTITVLVVGNPEAANPSLFTVNLSGAVNAMALGSQGVGTILPTIICGSLNVTATNGSNFVYWITGRNNPTSYSSTGLPAGLGINTSTGLISGVPTVTGTFPVTISATNGDATGSATLTIVVQPSIPVQTYASWKNTWFNSAQLGNPAISGETAAPASDGIPNLIKYALGLNPNTSYSGTSVGIPYSGLSLSSSNQYLSLTFTGTASDVTYSVEAASNLTGAWSTLFISALGKAPGTVVVSDTVPISGVSKRFMHLKVIGP